MDNSSIYIYSLHARQQKDLAARSQLTIIGGTSNTGTHLLVVLTHYIFCPSDIFCDIDYIDTTHNNYGQYCVSGEAFYLKGIQPVLSNFFFS